MSLIFVLFAISTLTLDYQKSKERMSLLFLLLSFLVSLVFGDIIDIWHKGKSATGTTGIRDEATHKTIIITVKYKSIFTVGGESGIRREELIEKAREDHCELLSSLIHHKRVILKISCEKTMDNLVETDDVPPLVNIETYLTDGGVGEIEEMDISVNRRYNKPSYWYGGKDNYETLQYAYSQYRARQTSPIHEQQSQLHMLQVESPAPWGLDRIDMHFGFLDNEYLYNYTGENVDVYVIDTGIRTTHVEFEGRASFLINTVGDGRSGDCVGHGTHVASVVGSKTYGVAKKTQLFAVKVLDCTGTGDVFTIITGLLAVIEHHKTRGNRAAIASLSLGGDRSNTLDQAMLTLIAANITTIVAAGNEDDDACKYSPSVLSATSSVISVAASTVHDRRPGWSNYGSCVSISAPGDQIMGAYHQSDQATTVLSGTSMATPFVSGVAALALEQNVRLLPSEVKLVILNWATPNTISGTTAQGGGKNLLYSLININQLPDIITPQTPPPPPSQIIMPPPPPPPSRPYWNGSETSRIVSLWSLVLCLYHIVWILTQ
jgi:subtilisin family serine protease